MHPFKAPDTVESSGAGQFPRHLSVPAESPSLNVVALAGVVVAFVCLAEFFALDYFIVRIRPYPDEANAHDGTLLMFPVLPTLLLWIARQTRFQQFTIGQIATSLFFGFVLAIPLIATVGLWVHFAIGGSL